MLWTFRTIKVNFTVLPEPDWQLLGTLLGNSPTFKEGCKIVLLTFENKIGFCKPVPVYETQSFLGAWHTFTSSRTVYHHFCLHIASKEGRWIRFMASRENGGCFCRRLLMILLLNVCPHFPLMHSSSFFVSNLLNVFDDIAKLYFSFDSPFRLYTTRQLSFRK